MRLEIIKAEYLDGYRMLISFNDGQRKVFDFSSLIDKYPVFMPLKNLEIFKSYTITDTLEWNDSTIDIAPEYLYEHGVTA